MWRNAGGGRSVAESFEKVAEDGLIGVEAAAGILEVDDDGVEVGEIGGLRAAVGVVRAVEGADGKVGGGCRWSC